MILNELYTHVLVTKHMRMASRHKHQTVLFDSSVPYSVIYHVHKIQAEVRRKNRTFNLGINNRHSKQRV